MVLFFEPQKDVKKIGGERGGEKGGEKKRRERERNRGHWNLQ